MNLSELTFFRHSGFGFLALAEFPNGHGLSILPESDGEHYEIAILKNGSITYDSGLTSDVLRFVTVDDIDRVAAIVREFPESVSQ